MGLVGISGKMTTSVSIPSSGSRNPPSSASVSSTSPASISPDQVVRKKRTFDIAFLTGQSEKESTLSSNNNGSLTSAAVDYSDRDSPPTSNSSNNNNIERKCASFLSNERSRSPYNLAQDGTNSDSSSIDVMTNGSLSESESQSHSPSSSIPEHPSPPLRPVVLIHHQHQLHQLRPNASSSSNGGISHRNSNNSAHDHHQHHHHHVDIKSNGGSPLGGLGASSGHKSRNNRSPVKEEIRFESRRTIDINQTVDSLKIKENLQFSTLLPSSAAMGLGSGGSVGGSGPVSGSSTSSRTISVTSGADLSLPHLASTIALLPHVARFPLGLPSLAASANAGAIHGNHHMSSGSMPFHAKMEKSESINISYPKFRGGFPDPYAALAASAAGGYPYPNILLPQELSRHPAFPSPLGSPSNTGMGGGSSSAGSGNGGQQVNQGPQQSPCGLGPSTTLLPPSLTSLTLPAQNVCAKCNIGFRMTSDLVYHMRSHHRRDTDPMKKQREEKLKCPVCHETFRERHHLTRHMTAHNDRAEEA